MKEIQSFCNQVNPSMNGMIWISKSDLNKDCSYFEEINYLLDGLLVKDLNLSKESSKTRFFLSEQFGHPFFVIYINNESYSLKELESNLNLAFQFNESNKQILVIDELKKAKNDLPPLKKKFKQCEFVLFQ